VGGLLTVSHCLVSVLSDRKKNRFSSIRDQAFVTREPEGCIVKCGT
jgi:hypothetical protein